MQSLTFVLERTLLAPLVEFAMSSSGHVEPRRGLAFGWLGSVVAGLAVVFGTADRAQADSCFGASEGEYGYEDTNSPCLWEGETPVTYWTKVHYHDPVWGCTYQFSVCG